ncbi:MAG: aminomethyl-transferring glycine dehydrogenase subunit GcvPA [Clostridiales bacterium]|nr:aminomethyl-transferring glycine dehydrogenase subunit GcvPA [Clostridiales bacterium]
MRYISNTAADKESMLKEIGVDSIEALFEDIPKEVYCDKLNLPKAMSEIELIKKMKEIAQKNETVDKYTCFLGAGAYDHFIPVTIDQLILRQEFYTAYTPYQPEISQGTLQSIFEYQTMICELTGMDVANASMYDGTNSLVEAAILACSVTKRSEVLVAKSVHPESRQVLKTYARFKKIKVTEVDYLDGQLDISDLEAKINSDTAALLIQSPNFFGIIEDIAAVEKLVHDNKSLLIVSTDPISLAVLKSPGELGADIAVGEGQPLGNPLSYGGPYLGFFATKEKYMRRVPGRIIGQTVDQQGRRGFVLTLQTREQHIRREKATSNICSNQGLIALTAAMYMTFMGKEGLREVAEQSLMKAHYAYEKLIETGKFKPLFDKPFYKEFALESTEPVDNLNEKLLKANILGGYQLGRDYPELEKGWLVAVTEKRTKEEIDRLVREAVK